MNKQIAFLSAIGLTIGLMAATPPASKPIKRVTRTGNPASAPKTPFIDRQNMNLAVKPGDDFYQYANGEWLKKNPVPASKTSWGSFNLLREKSLDAMKSLLDDAAKTTAKGRLYQMVGDFYASGMDSAAIDNKGFDPLKADLGRVDQVKNKADVLNEMAYQRTQGNSMLFGFYVGQDRKNVSKYLPQLGQGGTTVPDRDYSLKNDARSQKIRDT